MCTCPQMNARASSAAADQFQMVQNYIFAFVFLGHFALCKIFIFYVFNCQNTSTHVVFPHFYLCYFALILFVCTLGHSFTDRP